MPKVVTSQGGLESTEVFKEEQNKTLNETLAQVDTPLEHPAPQRAEDEEAEDQDLPERAAKRIAKKHREMKEAQEAAAESERFAETQFNTAKALEKRAADLERELSELKARTPLAPKPELLAPLEADFYEGVGAERRFKADEYIKAVTQHAAETARVELRAEMEQAAQNAALQANQAAFAKRIEAAVKKTPDWKEVVGDSTVQLPNPVLEYIGMSDYGTDLAYYLAKNPSVAETFKALPAIKAIAAIGKLETSFEKPAEPIATLKTVTSGAPAPITPIPERGTTVAPTDPAKMTYKELRAYERSRRKR